MPSIWPISVPSPSSLVKLLPIESTQLGSLAIHTACSQMANFKDETLRQHLKRQLIRVAHLFGEGSAAGLTTGRGSSDRPLHPETLLDLMPDLALNLSVGIGDTEEVIAEFVDIMTQVVAKWWEVGLRSWFVIQRLCEELPASHSKQFWPLFVRLRAG
jgi:hypothetical protein